MPPKGWGYWIYEEEEGGEYGVSPVMTAGSYPAEVEGLRLLHFVEVDFANVPYWPEAYVDLEATREAVREMRERGGDFSPEEERLVEEFLADPHSLHTEEVGRLLRLLEENRPEAYDKLVEAAEREFLERLWEEEILRALEEKEPSL